VLLLLRFARITELQSQLSVSELAYAQIAAKEARVKELERQLLLTEGDRQEHAEIIAKLKVLWQFSRGC
jgi:hypothetical protein